MTDSAPKQDRPDYVWRTRVSPEGPRRASVYARKHSFLVGAPLDFDQEGDTVSALEYLLGALGADVLNGFRAEAERRRLPLDQVEVKVEGRLDNPLTYLNVVGETGHPGLSHASVMVYASSPAPEQSLREAWAESLDRSPLVCTLRPSVALALDLRIVP